MSALAGELRKLPAFVRRDFLVAWSYRLPFVGDWIGLGLQAFMFYFLGLMVDPSKLPSYGGQPTSYMEFVAVGIAISAFITLALARVAVGMQQEQLAGTLESLLMTPTSPATVQLGAVVYDLIYIPIRTAVFLVVIALAFGLDFYASGLVPALVVLVVFIPFVWGLGVASAGATLTFRRGSGIVGLGTTLLVLFSGAYYPLDVLPDWVASLAELNPITIAVEGMREPLLGGTGWEGVGRAVAILLPLSVLSLALGATAFRAALRRERRQGTLGLYGAPPGNARALLPTPALPEGTLVDANGAIRTNPQAVYRELAGGGGVLLHLESGAYHGLNETGSLIWDLLDGERDLTALVADLRQQLDDAPDDLGAETERFLADLRERDLIAP